MKRHILLLSAASLAVCSMFTSCSEASKSSFVSDNSISASETPQELAEEETEYQGAYRLDKLNIPQLEGYSINRIIPVSNPDGFVLDIYNENSDKILFADKDFSQFTEIEPEYPDEYKNSDEAEFYPYISHDGTFIGLAQLTDHGGVKLPDEYDENFDYESFYDSQNDSTYMILHFDRQGKLISKAKVDGLEINEDWGQLDVKGFLPCGDQILGEYYDGRIFSVDSNGKVKIIYTPELANEEYGYGDFSLSADRDGKILYTKTEYTKNVDSQTGYEFPEPHYALYEFDAEKGTLGDLIYNVPDNEYHGISSVMKGMGKYRLFIVQNNVMGLTDDGQLETVINWINSDTEPMGIYPIGEDKFIGCTTDYNAENYYVTQYMLTPRDPSDFKDRKILTIASTGVTPSTAAVGAFNREQNEYRVVFKDYTETDTSSIEDQIKMDLISGDAPDIICGLNHSCYENLRQKGAFVDLYQFIDKDKNGRDAYLNNVLKSLESSNDELNAITANFAVRTLATKTSVWNKENWTMDEMLKLHDEAPATADHLYDGDSKTDIFNLMIYSMGELIDYEKAECHFNSPEFVKMLEFCNRFVDEVPLPGKDDPEAYEKYYSERWHWFANERVYTDTLIFSDISAYSDIRSLDADGAEITFAGFPSSDGKGGRIVTGELVSISSSCSEKEGAWEFIREGIINRNDTAYDNYLGTAIPILKTKFTEDLDFEMTAERTASGHPIAPLTKEERDRIEKYILSCDAPALSMDEDIENICLEESEAYFQGGQTAQQAADMIQNRVSILISERS